VSFENSMVECLALIKEILSKKKNKKAKKSMQIHVLRKKKIVQIEK
jgi:hypothetical protein